VRARFAPAAAALALGLPATLVAGPEPEGPATQDETYEASHNVTVVERDGVAVVTVRRVFVNPTRSYDEEGYLEVPLPEGGAVTGFRLLGVNGWVNATLEDADAAAQRYEDLRLPGTAPVRRVALLSWSEARDSGLTMSLFGLQPRQLFTVEYDLVAPVEYEAGRRFVAYPDPGEEVGEKVLELGPPRSAFAARWGTWAASTGTTFARVEVDVAAELEAAPKGARVVFVVDGSISAGAESLAGQLDLARGYLAHVPDAEFEIIVTRRDADGLVGGFAEASTIDEVLAAIPAPRLEPGNGSNLHAGLAAAARALRGWKGPARIVAFTDGYHPSAFTTATALHAMARVPKGTILHLVAYAPDGDLYEERVFEDELLAPVAARHGGVVLAMNGRSGDRAALADLTRGLVRPIRVDQVTSNVAELELPAIMWEGTGHHENVVLDTKHVPDELIVRGLVWGRTVAFRLAPDAGLSRSAAALAVGDDDARQALSRDELLEAAHASGAVSPHTSYLATDVGAGPSAAGEEAEGFGISGGSGGGSYSSHCGGAHSMIGRVVELRRVDERAAHLAEWVEAGARACQERAGGAAVAATFSVETTRDEIVGVRVAGVSDRALATCLEDAMWAVRLDAAEFDTSHDLVEVPLKLGR
jgi:hypothetical protein